MFQRHRSSAPPIPAGFDAEALFAGVHWHQRWELFDGVFLPGRNDVGEILNTIGFPEDLTGKRVLDIGAWNGGFTFECERRGASEVVAFSLENPATSGFNQIRAALGSKATYVLGSVYNLDPAALGVFDIVLFLGVLYHLRYPLLAADKIRGVTRGEVFIETHVIERCFIPPGRTSNEAVTLAQVSPVLLETPIWQFYRHGELNADPSNWFGPNIPAVLEGFGSAGFDVQVVKSWGGRAAFRATPTRRTDFEQTYEGQSPTLQQGLNLRLTDD